MPPIEFPNRIYADVIQTFSDTLVLNNTCEIVLSITPTSTTSYVPATVVHVQFGATYMELAMDNATNIIVQPGSNIAFDVLNADSVDVCIAINIYNVTCDVEYGNVIESMCVSY
jgi:hydroxyacyl-ACP dehydratase HTD2-like protein with hotdog domain